MIKNQAVLVPVFIALVAGGCVPFQNASCPSVVTDFIDEAVLELEVALLAEGANLHQCAVSNGLPQFLSTFIAIELPGSVKTPLATLITELSFTHLIEETSYGLWTRTCDVGAPCNTIANVVIDVESSPTYSYDDAEACLSYLVSAVESSSIPCDLQ